MLARPVIVTVSAALRVSDDARWALFAPLEQHLYKNQTHVWPCCWTVITHLELLCSYEFAELGMECALQ